MSRRIRQGVGVAILGVMVCAMTGWGERIQFGWKELEGPVDGAARIIDWQGRYKNFENGVTGRRARFGSFLVIPGEQRDLFLNDPLTGLLMRADHVWAVDQSVAGAVSVGFHALGVMEGPNADLNAGESIEFSFNQAVKLYSLFWMDLRGAAVSINVGDQPKMSTLSSPLLHLKGVVLPAGQVLKVRVVMGSARLGAITVEALNGRLSSPEATLLRAAQPEESKFQVVNNDGVLGPYFLVHLGAGAVIALLTMVALLTTRRE